MLKHRFTRSLLIPCSENIFNYENIIVSAGKKKLPFVKPLAAGYGIARSQELRTCYRFIYKTWCIATNMICACKKSDVLIKSSSVY